MNGANGPCLDLERIHGFILNCMIASGLHTQINIVSQMVSQQASNGGPWKI